MKTAGLVLQSPTKWLNTSAPLSQVHQHPYPISTPIPGRIMMFKPSRSEQNQSSFTNSCYPGEDKQAFYDSLSAAFKSVPANEHLCVVLEL